MYYVYSKGGKIDPVFQVIENILFEYKVDLVVGAHVHNTFASCPVYNGTCISPKTEGEYDAPVHVGIGNGGAQLDLVSTNFFELKLYAPLSLPIITLRLGTQQIPPTG